MKRLKHHVRGIREPFGKAGTVIGIVALVFAMVGGAFAAGALTAKQKKEVEKIAKKYTTRAVPPANWASEPRGPAASSAGAIKGSRDPSPSARRAVLTGNYPVLSRRSGTRTRSPTAGDPRKDRQPSRDQRKDRRRIGDERRPRSHRSRPQRHAEKLCRVYSMDGCSRRRPSARLLEGPNRPGPPAGRGRCAGDANEGGAIFALPAGYQPPSSAASSAGSLGSGPTLAQVAVLDDAPVTSSSTART